MTALIENSFIFRAFVSQRKTSSSPSRIRTMQWILGRHSADPTRTANMLGCVQHSSQADGHSWRQLFGKRAQQLKKGLQR
eukprot:2541602-Amphidinium_carterae.1